jgi:hypothetical protein
MGFFSSAKSFTMIAKLLLNVVNKITDYFGRKQLIDAGKAKQAKKSLKEANNVLSEAIDARRDADREFKSNDGMPKGYEYYRGD